jgi:dihydrofolate reductase
MTLAVDVGLRAMNSTTCQISVSLDGYVAGPNQGRENPLGEGGMRLHEWAFATDSWRAQHGLDGGSHTADSEVIKEVSEGVGAYVMGRNMFAPADRPLDEAWIGWWGENPPFHVPVFVLTHHARQTLSLHGGTTFTFVTDGIQSALHQARAAAGENDVAVAGGASTVRQYLAAGLLDELYLHIVPVILGGGERLLEGVGDPVLEPDEVIASPAVTHIKYRIARD